MGDMGQVLAILQARQGAETNAAFARRLGISRAYWSHILAGRRRLSEQLVRRAVRLYPEVGPQYLAELVNGDGEDAA